MCDCAARASARKGGTHGAAIPSQAVNGEGSLAPMVDALGDDGGPQTLEKKFQAQGVSASQAVEKGCQSDL